MIRFNIFFWLFPFNIIAAELDGILDKNTDGIQDVFYDYYADGTYRESVDSNYDGKIDSYCNYDSNDTVILCAFDQDKNSILDTFVEYEDGNPIREGVSIDGSDTYEIIFSYESGVMKKGYRYYQNDREIGVTTFEFGYPIGELRIKTELSRSEFHKMYWR